MEGTSQREGDPYVVLNVPRDASQEAIRAAHNRLSLAFHPDRVRDQALLPASQVQFMRVQRAYDLLSDEGARAAFDALGAPGFAEAERMGATSTLSEYYRAPAELRAEFEALRAREEKQRLEAKLAMDNRAVIGLSMAHVLRPYRGATPTSYYPEVTRFTVTQSVASRLSSKDVLGLRATADVGGQNEAGGFRTSYTRHADVAQVETYVELQSRSPKAGVSLSNPLSEHSFGVISLDYGDDNWILTTSVRRKLSQYWHGSIKWLLMTINDGMQGLSLSASFADNETGHTGHAAVTLMPPLQVHPEVQANRRLSQRSYIFAVLRCPFTFGDLGPEIALGAKTRLSENTTWGINMALGLSGVFLKANVKRGSIKFVFPVLLSPYPSDWRMAVWATLLPTAAILLAKKYIVLPRRRARRDRQRAEAVRTTLESAGAEMLIANSVVAILQNAAEARARDERASDGLVILDAKYGNLDVGTMPELVREFEEANMPTVIDVAIPLQFLVSNSRLAVPGGSSKADLPGFFACFPSQDSRLEVRYEFRGEIYFVALGDLDELSLPAAEHRVFSHDSTP